MLVCEECGEKYTGYIQKRACPLEGQYLLEEDAVDDGWTVSEHTLCPDCGQCNYCDAPIIYQDVVDMSGPEVRIYRRCEYGHENPV